MNLKYIIICIFGCLLSATVVSAEDDLRYPFLERSAATAKKRIYPLRPRYITPQRFNSFTVETKNDESIVRQVRPSALPVVTAAATGEAERLPLQAATVITVIGDSWGVQLAQGLREAMSAKPEIVIVNKAQSDTGLVNTTVHDWPKSVHDMTLGNERNDATIIMIGSNDNQPLRDETGILEPGTDKWKELYSKRIDDIILPFRDRKIPLLWVGAPITKLDKLNANLSILNKLYKERIQASGFVYVETYDIFADIEGHYSSTGPDINGENVKLRADDAVHFTKAGARKLAFFVEKDLNALLSGRALKTDSINLPATPQAPVDINGVSLNSLPLPDAAGLSPLLNKREAGPVLSLTTQPEQGADQFVQRSKITVSKFTSEVFIEGKVPYPKPNRGDDFSWPRR